MAKSKIGSGGAKVPKSKAKKTADGPHRHQTGGVSYQQTVGFGKGFKNEASRGTGVNKRYKGKK